MHRRYTRVAGALAAATLALGASAVAGTTQAARAAEPGSPLTLWAPERLVAYSYEGQVYTDLGFKLIAPVEPFEIWSHRATYDDPITSEWRPAVGPAVPLPEGTMTSFMGLDEFLDLTVTRVRTGEQVQAWSQTACLNGYSQRISPDAPARSPYPIGCPWNPYTVGSVMGIQGGHASPLFSEFGTPLSLKPGKYDVAATIAPKYTALFGIAAEDAAATTRLVVRKESFEFARSQAPRESSDDLRPAAQEPRGTSGGRLAPGNPQPDLRSLPAFGIQLNRKGTVLRFAANVWNAGDSPVVIDGFRNSENEEVMDTYQYFFDDAGNQTGYQQVGTMQWHAGNHNHWHFEDFAQYRLLNEDLSQAVLSTKQSFCLANTDAVDYTVDGADWRPEGTDLSTACGGFDALSVRQVLSSGSGDTYMQYRHGQAFPVKNLPNGTYFISVEANPLHNLVESDTTNNDSLRKITLKGKVDNRRVVVEQVGIVDETMAGFFGRAAR